MSSWQKCPGSDNLVKMQQPCCVQVAGMVDMGDDREVVVELKIMVLCRGREVDGLATTLEVYLGGL